VEQSTDKPLQLFWVPKSEHFSVSSIAPSSPKMAGIILE